MSGLNSPTFRRSVLAKNHAESSVCVNLVASLAYSPIFKMEAIRVSETSRRHILVLIRQELFSSSVSAYKTIDVFRMNEAEGGYNSTISLLEDVSLFNDAVNSCN